MYLGFGSRESHEFFFIIIIFLFIIFFMFFLSLLLQCKFNITVSTQILLRYFIIPSDAQASSAFSALILLG